MTYSDTMLVYNWWTFGDTVQSLALHFDVSEAEIWDAIQWAQNHIAQKGGTPFCC